MILAKHKMDKKTFLQSGLLKGYLLGLTSEEENREVSQIMELYPELAQEVETMQRFLEAYARTQTEKNLQNHSRTQKQ